ncbi:hypothetical protein ACRE_026810 [Hapsidospora chrysogenum ATCC 11550]|uniref:Uncharacterized protein n=1 Tax=Hapsidospora chrysogenum (strain ATCC 11550 / CBS 779.69 / DSM 880 / IAM 14645 / JCM 23072 / IMI 49137) TaxID=857340 RepID=A0A086TAS0_HAPC1|nr:hypothetical protein ACRE_026810 [Hapsidospora chrysogenum ATCC 11550]
MAPKPLPEEEHPSTPASTALHHAARIIHIILAIQLLPLTAILISNQQILGLGFIPVGFSTAVASILLRLRSRGGSSHDADDEVLLLGSVVIKPAAEAVLDAFVAAGMAGVLALALLLPSDRDMSLMQVYTGALMSISLALHAGLAIRGWLKARRDEGYTLVPKNDKI